MTGIFLVEISFRLTSPSVSFEPNKFSMIIHKCVSLNNVKSMRLVHQEMNKKGDNRVRRRRREKNARKCLARTTDLWETRGRKQQHHRIEINDFVLFPIVVVVYIDIPTARCVRYNENVGSELNEFLCHTPTTSSQNGLCVMFFYVCFFYHSLIIVIFQLN